MWGIWKFDDVIHIVPEDDSELHNFSPHCKCEPRTEEEDDIVIYIHDAFDGRIAVERANEILNDKG